MIVKLQDLFNGYKPDFGTGYLSRLKQDLFVACCNKTFLVNKHIPMSFCNVINIDDNQICDVYSDVSVAGTCLFLLNDRLCTIRSTINGEIEYFDMQEDALDFGVFLKEAFASCMEDSIFHVMNMCCCSGHYIVMPEQLTMSIVTCNIASTSGVCRLYVVVGSDSNITITHAILNSLGWFNVCIEFIIGENSAVNIIQDCDQCNSYCYCLYKIRCGANCNVTISSSGARSEWLWLDFVCYLSMSGSSVDLCGKYELVDKNSVFITSNFVHEAAHTTSNQVLKKILSGDGRSVFGGSIVIGKRAAGSQAYQFNKDLVCTYHVDSYSMPVLKIDNGDVKASHGSTTREIDMQDMFFLKSRGIGHSNALSMLKMAFWEE